MHDNIASGTQSLPWQQNSSLDIGRGGGIRSLVNHPPNYDHKQLHKDNEDVEIMSSDSSSSSSSDE